jgi:hypothetical protein
MNRNRNRIGLVLVFLMSVGWKTAVASRLSYGGWPTDSLTAGVVQLKESAEGVLKICNSDGTVWHRIDLAKDDRIDQYVKPFSIKLDYQNLVFRCIGDMGDYYKVIVNEGTGLIKYIRHDDLHFSFSSWDKHVLSVFSVGFDPKKNPLKKMPAGDAATIPFVKDEFYLPVEIKGDWLKVKWGDVGKQEYGWIKWRSRHLLRVELFYTE